MQARQISLFLTITDQKVQRGLQCIWGACRTWHHYLWWEKVGAKGHWKSVA